MLTFSSIETPLLLSKQWHWMNGNTYFKFRFYNPLPVQLAAAQQTRKPTSLREFGALYCPCKINANILLDYLLGKWHTTYLIWSTQTNDNFIKAHSSFPRWEENYSMARINHFKNNGLSPCDIRTSIIITIIIIFPIIIINIFLNP